MLRTKKHDSQVGNRCGGVDVWRAVYMYLCMYQGCQGGWAWPTDKIMLCTTKMGPHRPSRGMSPPFPKSNQSSHWAKRKGTNPRISLWGENSQSPQQQNQRETSNDQRSVATNSSHANPHYLISRNHVEPAKCCMLRQEADSDRSSNRKGAMGSLGRLLWSCSATKTERDIC